MRGGDLVTEYELFYNARQRLERVWAEAERLTRVFAASGHYASDEEADISRAAGGRA